MYGPFGRQFITQSESGVLEANCTITVSDIGMSRRPPTGLYFKPSDVTIAGACGAISSDWWAATAGEHQQTRHRYFAARNTFQLHDYQPAEFAPSDFRTTVYHTGFVSAHIAASLGEFPRLIVFDVTTLSDRLSVIYG